MKKIITFAIIAIACLTSTIKADIVVDSLSRMTFTPVINEQNASSPLSGIELQYFHTQLNTIYPFRIFQYNSATWMRWMQLPSTRSLAIAYNGTVRMGDFNTTSTDNIQTPRMLSLYNSSGIGLYIEQNNANAAINVNVNNQDAYVIKATAPLWEGSNNISSPRVIFSVDANGEIYHENSMLTLSDENHKRDIQTVTNVSAGLREMNPVSYILTTGGSNENTTQLRNRSNASDNLSFEDDFVPDSIVNEVVDPTVRNAMNMENIRPKYGFVAQEIEKIFPNVVYTLSNGEKAIAYQEIIPLLVSAFQEQQNLIDSLANRIENLEMPATQQRQQAPAAMQDAITDGSAALMQNTPNPFNQATEIGYRLPEGSATALIIVCDMNGKMLQTYPLAVNSTNGTLTIQAGSYTPGMYLYTLIIDGVQIDTKQMIILAH